MALYPLEMMRASVQSCRMADGPSQSLALIGFGEAGESFARAGGWSGFGAWDVLEPRREVARGCGALADDCESVIADAAIVLSLVTADAALGAARDYAAHLRPGALWLDMNSVAPGTKRDAAQAVEAAGAHYVDVAVMAPVGKKLAVPLLLSGPQADRAAEALAALGFTNVRCVGSDIGRASAIKMIRSVMVKGMEALSRECADAAIAAGVLEDVTASLDASEKAAPWAERFAYNRERMDSHGLRRAAEMEEVCATLSGLGVEPVMSRATVIRQREAGAARRSEHQAESQTA